MKRRKKMALRMLDDMDRRTQEYRVLKTWRDALVNDLGGEDGLTLMQRELIETALRFKVETLKTTARPGVRKALIETLKTLLGDVPKKPVKDERKVPSLDEIRQRYNEKALKKAQRPKAEGRPRSRATVLESAASA
jgi:hypothetical protein